jgi:spoIIIJ-associated protein
MDQKMKEMEKITKIFFEKLGIEAEIKKIRHENDTIYMDAETKEKEFVTKDSIIHIQHLLSAICKKKIDQNLVLDFDLNDYKKKRIKFLINLANSLAEEAILTKKEKISDPLPAFERKIIHTELAKRNDVTTESIGKEPTRRVIIKPKL